MSVKTIFILRHAKSSWKDYSLSDFDRGLNKRGKRDAPFMAKKLSTLHPSLDLIITSSAKRARLTSKHFKDAFGLTDNRFWMDKKLYHAMPETISDLIRECPNEYNSILIAAHNPGLTYFVNGFPHFSLDNLPTCGIVEISLNISEWSHFDFESGKVQHFYYPKQYFK